ncbi:MAG: hypothetical protein IJK74_01860 [Bacteroidales bacterium]|nr:hypothetical protein [Bacteroidales bacterium]
MKRLFLTAIAVCTVAFGQVFGQGISTAFELSDFQREGTARSVAMGNAMTALGGDMGAIAINPAASAVFKFNEFSFTPAITSVNTDTKYLGVNTSANRTTFGLANIGGVAVIPTGERSGVRSISFGFTYNKHNNFNAAIKAGADGVDDSYIWKLTGMANKSGLTGFNFDDTANPDPFSHGSYFWPVVLGWNGSLLDTIQTKIKDVDVFYPTHLNGTEAIKEAKAMARKGYTKEQISKFINEELNKINYTSSQLLSRKSYGSIGEYDLNFGMNISDQFYVGMNLGMFTVWNKVEEVYSEDNTTSYSDADGHFGYVDQYYNQRTTGAGINLKFGFIWAPSYNFRVGASVSTPTWYSLTDKYYWDTNVSFDDGYKASLHSPEGVYDYRVNTPFHYNLGFATVFKGGSISVDYEGSNVSQTRFRNRADVDHYDYSDFSYENNWMTDNFKMSNKLRIGAEVYPVQNVALRAGFQYADNGIKKDVMNTAIKNYTGSFGVGMTFGGGFYLDLAVAASLKKSTVPFLDTESAADYVLGDTKYATMDRSNVKVLATFGWRF